MSDERTSDPATADDVGLPILDSEGNQLGVVADVDGDDVVVDPDSDVSDDARASLGWETTEDVNWTLPRPAVERVPGEDVLETFPKTALDSSTDEDGVPGAVLRVDLGDVNR